MEKAWNLCKSVIRNLDPVLFTCATLLSLIALLLDIITMPITGMPPSPTVIFLCLFLVFFDVYFILLYTVILKRNLKKNPLLNARVEYEFYDDFFVDNTTSDSVNQRTEVKYDMIVLADESENYIYLYINKMTAHIIDKNGFTVGTEEMLKDLLRQKLPSKKIKFN